MGVGIKKPRDWTEPREGGWKGQGKGDKGKGEKGKGKEERAATQRRAHLCRWPGRPPACSSSRCARTPRSCPSAPARPPRSPS